MADSGGYQVVARRYRPQVFADLVGQEHVARGLLGAIESGRIGHAYLFTGARGVGKTSAARIYAKALACDRGPGAEPCNACDSCLAIAAGQDVDVVEIDAASNRGVDEIRQLRQNASVRPARGRFKVYIIDEVHMLTREAFNALLKTLEEPPAHVKFVLCTTEPEKLPITILSRCQRFDFTIVDTPSIARRLAQIVEAEGADVSPEALMLIARRAAGSMRDSQSLLEQLLGSASGPIGVDDVHALIGTGREERIGELIAAVAGRDSARALRALDAALVGGADAGGVLEQMIAALRDCLLASVGCDAAMLSQSEAMGIDLAAVGGQLGTATLLAMLQILDHALSRMRSSGHAALLAEMAVIRLAALEDLESVANAIERLAGSAAGVSPARTGQVAPAAAPPRAAPSPAPAAPQKKTTDLSGIAAESIAPKAAGLAASEPSLPGGRPEPPAPPVEAMSTRQSVGRELPEDPLAAWRAAVEMLDGLAADFAAEVTSAAWSGGTLEVSLPARAATAASFLKRPEVASSITRSLESRAGRFVRHVILLSPDGPEAAAPTVAGEPVARPVAVQTQAALLREAAEHPLVAHARTVFDAAIRKVEPARSLRPVAIAAGRAATATGASPAAGADAGDEEEGFEDRSDGGMEEGNG